MKKTITYLIVLASATCFSQTKEQLKDVLNETDREVLSNLSVDFHNDFLKRQERIKVYLNNNPFSKRKFVEEGNLKEMYDVSDNGEISYYSTSNYNSSRTSRANKLYSGGGLGLNIQGQGMKAFVWDGGAARNTHVEFPNNKVSIMDGSSFADHATHVTGTIVAQGLTLVLRGVAFDASADSYDWNDDYSEMSIEASNGMLISNHSYWSGVNSAWNFGAYDSRAKGFDQIAFAAPYYLGVTAAGNDRNDFSDPVVGPLLASKGGYNIVRGMQNAKNFLTVGAVSQVLNYTGPSSVTMSDFSSWGPTDDGRIKPEIVTKGVGVRSTFSTSDTASGLNQGTSMASPGIAGTALLLQQYYNSQYIGFMRAATLKGLLLHTADESGSADGPDYEFGWGLANAEKAANVITNKPLSKSILEESTLVQGQVFTKTIYSDGSQPINVSISWTDRAYPTQNNGTVDPATLYLVNDLDVRVIKGTDTYYPWTLDPSLPTQPAQRNGDNFRDNFEKIQIDTPLPGQYTVQVTHKGSLTSGAQNFSLIVSGIDQTLSNTSFDGDDSLIVYPNPVNDELNFSTLLNNTLVDVLVTDVYGKIVLKNKASLKSIDVSNLQAGVYFVKLTTENKKIFTKKFIKS